ncbi:MAG: hypothetical protein LBS31_08790 [Candidatus Adiutrix sp.]|nr:hypothetical protein [Candidatus Adiutrix sp.]
MSGKKMMSRAALLLVALVLTLGLSACRQAPLRNLSNLPAANAYGATLKAEQVKAAILAGCKDKGWVARELRPGALTATLAVRRHMAEVEIPYSGSNYSIIYKSSSNLDYNPAKDSIHNQYNNWVEYLRQAINARLAETK